MIIEFSQAYNANDAEHRRWAIQVARQQVLKQLLLVASANWQYLMRFEEIHVAEQYTFRMTIDEVPL